MADHENDAASADEAHRKEAVEKRSAVGEPLAVSPKDTATAAAKPQAGPTDRPGTAVDEASKASGGLPGPGPGRDGEQAAAYQENDA